ncbi:MAG TPA: heavy metal-associated domain-containing protein, partial [Chitinophagaceae bacterium]|nr:heavy metal-associated domain-containing protein [Chitinophagaceae bacterium]
MLVEKEFLIFVIMNGETLSIKNMVCQRCISAVETILAAQDIKAEKVSLGEIILPKPLSPKDKQQLAEKLEKTGFEILDNKEQALVSSIKNLLIDLIHHQDLSDFHQNPSDYLSQKLHKDYNYLSKLFSET